MSQDPDFLRCSPGPSRRLARRRAAFGGWRLAVLVAAAFWAGPLIAGPDSEPVDFSIPVNPSPAVAVPAPPSVPPQQLLAEGDLVSLLTAALQRDYVKDSGQLELRLSQPWKPVRVPEGPVTLKVLDMPPAGVAPVFVMRFEVRAAGKAVGTWDIVAQAHVWREMWVARSPLRRGQSIADADIARERRDVLAIREPPAMFRAGNTALEVAEPVPTGWPLLARSVRLRPVVHRGQSVDACLRDGVLSITLKAQALEDGAPGQIIRARNMQTRRDICGKVIDEQTILVTL
jgi:flagella basal body P-ring formation protein FlgA